MREKTRSLASKVIELTVSGALALFLFAVLYRRLLPPALWAILFWGLAVLLPAAAVAVGCIRQRFVVSLAGWTALLLETMLVAHS